MAKHLLHFTGIAIAFCIALLFPGLPLFSEQDAPTTTETETAATSESIEPFGIKINVNEVRLDVVVLDKNGNPVTDLTAADFEVFQDKKRQEITSSVYIKHQADVATQPAASQKDSRSTSLLPAPALKQEDVGRTIIFIVDDNSMTFENGYYAKMVLRNFVEKQMQPSDMVAVLRTSYGNSALQMFLYDKRQLLARIETMPMNMRWTRVNSDLGASRDLNNIYDNQLSSLSYSFRALKNMPGRKILVMLTGQTTLYRQLPLYEFYKERFHRLADDALRAGVVVNFLNIFGLEEIYVDAAPIVDSSVAGTVFDPRVHAMSTVIGKRLFLESLDKSLGMTEARKRTELATQVSLPNPLPVKTGGDIIENSNFFLDGIDKRTESLLKGYYLISYIPPPDTFKTDRKEVYHSIKVNVKRRGVEVHTRDGFFGRRNNPTDAAATSFPLQEAIFSPFQNADIDVNVAAGYVKDAKAGYLIRSWIHVEAEDMTIVENEEGGAWIEFETVCLTSDISGYVQDFKRIKYTFDIENPENTAWVRQHGIRFAMLLPVKKNGSYFVRVAVEDAKSGKVGSAYQFIEIPDLEGKKEELALSSIFMLTSADDLNWLRSDAAKGIEEGLFFPVFQEGEVRSPALGIYSSGDNLQALAMLYNAGAGAEIEIQPILYKDGKELLRGEPRLINPGDTGSSEGIPFLHRLTIGTDMSPGYYALQLVATDKKNRKKNEGVAVQTIGFTIAEK